MKNLLYIFLFILLAGILSTCKREYIGDYDKNYIGSWHSDTLLTSSGQREIYFLINGEHSEYGFMCAINCSSCDCQVLTSGKAVINHKHEELIIGSGNGNKRVRVKIKTPPYQDSSGKWICVTTDSKGTEIKMYKR